MTRKNIEQVLLPELDALAERTGNLNYLLVLENQVQDFTANAWWKDMISSLKHFTQWNRIAVVTNQKAVEIFTDLFELVVPGRSKGFRPDQLDEALTWVQAERPQMARRISPKWHAVIDYAMVGGLLLLPALFKLNRKARLIYAVEAAVLLPYVAITRHPVAVKGIIPFRTHGKIDPFNIAHFGLQSLAGPFRKHRKSLLFNITFTAVAGLTVLLTDYEAPETT
ncbi:STAS/SEC14 domain-containing protein [Mucilaginibacter sp. PAMB04274]|uniref:STAS/SEC14 domain-containing protein n=1 Tax=Mucilaginibacter sp. PAMB04274 TaxID=3138568 RepID=UPI0031F64CF6